MRTIKSRRLWIATGVGALAAVLVATAIAAGGRNHSADLSGFGEVPVVSTTGHGDFTMRKSADGQSVDWQLSYADIEGDVTQAHVHLAQEAVNGGISVFLCSNLGNGPAGTPPCPPDPATISGTFDSADVLGPAGQGIAAGELGELLDAVAAGVTYVNVHSSKHPGGEVRGQIRDGTSAN